MRHPSAILSKLLDPESERVFRSLVPPAWWEGVLEVTWITNKQTYREMYGCTQELELESGQKYSLIVLNLDLIRARAKELASQEIGFSYKDALETLKATTLFHELAHHAGSKFFGLKFEQEPKEEVEVNFFRAFVFRRFPHLRGKRVPLV